MAEHDLASKLSIKSIAGIISAIAVVLGAAFFVDERYVHAEGFKTAQTRQELFIERSTLETRKYYIEDRLQSIEAKPEGQLTDVDRANRTRYLRDRSDLDRRLRDIEQDMRKSK